MDWLREKVMVVALIAALGVTAGACAYNAGTEKELLNTEKRIERHVANIDAIYKQEEKADKDATAHFKQFFKH